MSIITEIADAVVSDINAATLSQPITATREYLPEHDLTELQNTVVTVVPKGVSIQGSTRGQNQHDYQVDIAVQEKVPTGGGKSEIDALMILVEEILDLFRLNRVTVPTLGSVPLLRAENDPIYAPEHLNQHGVFTSVITLTFRGLR